MIIEKVFSNIEEPEETLYSVLMTEEEISLFSDKIEREANLGYAKGALLGGLTGAGLAASSHLGNLALIRGIQKNKLVRESIDAAKNAGAINAKQAELAITPLKLSKKALAKSAGKGALAGVAIGAGLVGLRKLQKKKRDKNK